MNVLWIAGARVVGGAERVSLEIAVRLRRRGHDVRALLPRRGPLAEAVRARRVPVAQRPIGGSANVLSALYIRRAITDARADVAMVTTADEWVWTCLANRPAKTRLVLVRHMALPLPGRVERLAARGARAIVAVSEASREALTRSGIIRPGLVRVIMNPVRVPVRRAVPEDAERRALRGSLGLPAGGEWIGFLGGADPAKGIESLLDAVAEAARQRPDLHAAVCGRGAADVVVSLARCRGLENRVHALGDVEDVAPLLSAVDLVAMATPSRLGEGSPLVLIESLACGTPVVAAAVGGTAEIVGQNDDAAGWLTRPDDTRDLARAIVGLLRDPVARRRLAERGLQRSARFDPDLAAEAYERLFTEIVSRA